MRTPTAVQQPVHDGLRLLWTLRLHLRALDVRAPYCLARLRRIVSQVDYVLTTWPDEHWPTGREPDRSMPSKIQLVGQVQEVYVRLTDTTDSRTLTLLHAQQQVLGLLAFFF